MSLRGVGLVTRLELTQRVRSGRWKASLAAWFLVLVAVTIGMVSTFGVLEAGRDGVVVLHQLVLFFVLCVGLIIAPALTATSVNGDSRDGVLATVQATPLSPLALALGKLLAAWAASLAFLLVSLPVLLFTSVWSAMAPWSLPLAVAVIAALLLAVCAAGLGISSLTPRTGASTMLSYLLVAVLVVGLPMAFGLIAPALREEASVTMARPDWETLEAGSDEDLDALYADDGSFLDPDSIPCVETEYTEEIWHTRPVAPLLVPQPLVVLSDSQPGIAGVDYAPMFLIRDGVEDAFTPATPPESLNCAQWREREKRGQEPWEHPDPPGTPGWRWIPGLLVNLLIGGAGFYATLRRLRVPAGRLPRGVRIA